VVLNNIFTIKSFALFFTNSSPYLLKLIQKL